MKILVMGGTKFVSRKITEYFLKLNYNITTLNRGNSQDYFEGKVDTLKADRHNQEAMIKILKNKSFDYIIDVNAYTKEDVKILYNSLNKTDIKKYIFISSSAVYTEMNKMPIKESGIKGKNRYWKDYGLNKLEAEEFLLNCFKNEGLPIVILRPPYLYGPMNNLYRESYIFDCLINSHDILLPQEGKTKIQFLHIDDLCKQIETVMKSPEIMGTAFNVGNNEFITFEEWVIKCFEATGLETSLYYSKQLGVEENERDYFPFHDYQYYLDTTLMEKICPVKKDFIVGLKEAFKYYKENDGIDDKKNYQGFVKSILAK